MDRTFLILILTLLVSLLAVKAQVVVEDEVEVSTPTTTTTTEAPKIPCDGKNKVCVEPKLCIKGEVDGNTLTRNYNYVSPGAPGALSFFPFTLASVLSPAVLVAPQQQHRVHLNH